MGPAKGTAGELKVESSKNGYELHQRREESTGSNETAQGAVSVRSTETGQSSEEHHHRKEAGGCGERKMAQRDPATPK